MKLLQEDSIGGNQKQAYQKSPFLLLGSDDWQIMEKIQGETLGEALEQINQTIASNQVSGRSVDDEVAFLIDTLRKSFEMDAELVMHMTLHQDKIPLVDGRGDLLDPGREKDHLKTLLWGDPTEHGEQGYIPIMLERAKRYGLIPEGKCTELLLYSDRIMDTKGMRKVKRIINQTSRRRDHRHRVLPHGDLEPGNILIGYETSPIWPGLGWHKAQDKIYRPIDFGRTRYWNLGKDPVSLLSDPAYRALWELKNAERYGFKGPRLEFNEAVKKTSQGVPHDYALDEQSEEDWDASLFLHTASRAAKKMCRLRNEGLEVSVEETLNRGSSEMKKRLELTRLIHDYSTLFLGACERLGICGAYHREFAEIFSQLGKKDEEVLAKLSQPIV
ncbi:MAG: hypothetical protein AABX70_00890 [Nanoarchaeota archaeon]